MCWTLGSQSCANPTEDTKLNQNQLVAIARLLTEESPHHLLVHSNAPKLSLKLMGSLEPAPGAAQLAPSMSLSSSQVLGYLAWMSWPSCILRAQLSELGMQGGSSLSEVPAGIRTEFLQWLSRDGCKMGRKALWDSRSFATAASELQPSFFPQCSLFSM